MIRIKIFCILLICLFSSPCFAVTDWDTEVIIGLYDELKKFRQGHEDSHPTATTLDIYSGKNEFQPFQVIVYNGGDTTITGVNITVTESGGTYAHCPDFSSVDDEGYWIYKQDYITVGATGSRGDYGEGDWPDALTPKCDIHFAETRAWSSTGVSIAAGEVQGFWIDIGTRSSTATGSYTFNVTVTGGVPNKTATVTFHVGGFTLPSTSSLHSNMGFEQGIAYWRHGYASSQYAPDITDSDFQAFCRTYLREMLYHMSGGVDWSGGLPLIEYNESTNTVSDWTAYDAIMAPGFNGTLISNGPYSGAKVPTGFMFPLGWYFESQSEWETVTKDWFDHYDGEDWNPMETLKIYTVDEPPAGGPFSEACQKMGWANNINTGGQGTFEGGFVTKHYRTELDCIANGTSYSITGKGIFVPNAHCYTDGECSNSEWNRNEYYEYTNRTKRNHWTYLSCSSNGCNVEGGSSTYDQPDYSAVDAQAMYTRIVGWWHWDNEIWGELYWGINQDWDGTDSPWDELLHFGGHGDGTLLYPGVSNSGDARSNPENIATSTPDIGGTNDIPIPSIRLKLIREHREDREWMELLHNQNKDSVVDTQFATLQEDPPVGPHNWWWFTFDESDFRTARLALFNELAGISNSPIITSPSSMGSFGGF